MAYTIVKHRRGTLEEWQKSGLIPKEGELVIEEFSDGTRRCKIGNGATSFEYLPYIDERIEDKRIKDMLLEKVSAFESKIDSKLSEASSNIDVVQKDILNVVANTENRLVENITDVNEAFTAADKELSDAIKALSNKETLDNERVLEKVANLKNTTEQLLAADTKLTDSINTIATTSENMNKQLSEQLSSFNQQHINNQIDIIKELALIDETKKLSDAAIIDTFTKQLAKIYIELADLVDDDITILHRLFLLEDKFDGKLDIDLSEFERSLTEKVETLRSNVNLKLNDFSKELAGFEEFLKEFDVEAINKITDLEYAINKNNEDTLKNLSELNEHINETDSKLATTDENLEKQSKRISNLISLKDGSTTGDAELIDIRSGYNGITHLTAGDAVRAIGNDLEALKTSLPDYIPDSAVDGLLYENSQLWLTSKDKPVGKPVTITGGGGGGGSISIVRVKNNLPSNALTIAKGKAAILDFTYTSFENEVPTGDGTFTISINDKNIETLSGSIQHGVAKKLDISAYLKNGANAIMVTCTDQYGTSRSLYYTVSVVELRIESTFDSTRLYDDTITFRYKVFGQIEKTVHILVDGNEISTKKLGANVSGNENTLVIEKQSHGCHKITAYISAFITEADYVESNILEYEIICTEKDNNAAILASVYDVKKVTQGDLVSIPYIVYDPVKIESTIDLIVSSQVAGELIEIDRTSLVIGREQQFWKTRKYPTGTTVFTISYTYNLYGVTKTISKSHTVQVEALDIDVSAEEDSLQLYLSSQGRSNNEQNPAVWTFVPEADGNNKFETVTTTFSGFNWKTNGWVVDENGDTCLRLNGDARAVINFKPFKDDFKLNGKTIEFEFSVRDVNSRDTTVIDCYDGLRGFKATPDTAFLQSSGTKVSCRYKDEERIRVAVSVEYADSLSRFVSIYLDGILSGVQRYATTDNFAQNKPLNITLGSSLCGLDIYSIRVYDKALSTPQVLNNYIADKTEPTEKQQLIADNDILDENGKISYERVKALGKIPIITFTGPMPTYKGDKKKKVTRMKFEDPANPELNFDVLLDQIDVQGTSSQFYVRKNWKTKVPEAIPHMPGAIPAKVFCIKVDYAEATGTHNTGTANYVETFYDREEAILPPQKDDPRVRTTIQGFPCILFEKATEDSEPVFSSKGNFNYDKDAENAFGFTADYDSFGVECWEFCNNTSDPVNFVGEIPKNWLEDFEPRYVPESANFERIEELNELSELAASGKATMTEAQRQELSKLMEDCIANFKEMHDWVLSTATYSLVDGKRVPITPTPLAEAVTYGETTYTEDNEEYRLAKFKYEFTDYFNLHYSSIYYVFTFFALMTDQRAKNLFLTRWKGDDGQYRWYPYFYDNDTIFGINNEGAMVFDYYHEDTDQLGSSNVYNGQNSAFWNNFRICFPQKIQETYAKLRSDKILTYDALIDSYITNGSDKWSAMIYNEDADYKYISMARPSGQDSTVDASNLYQVRGPGEHHLRYFVDNRLNYCDSKWSAGEYPSDFYFLRIYTPSTIIPEGTTEEDLVNFDEEQVRIFKSLKAVPANPNITITPFSNMYTGVRYKSGTLQQQRVAAGESYTFTPLDPNETFGDTETAIYGASSVASLGDLSGLYCGVVNLAGKNTDDNNATQGSVKENKLIELIIGNAHPDYYNDNFREITVGTCKLLRKIDLRNCSGLGIAGKNPQKTLELSGCPNIEHIYTEGTNLESVDLPVGGYVKTLHLPASINTLVIKNQQYINDFSIESYDNIRILCLEDCPTLNTDEILAACRQEDGKYSVERVRLTGINWNLENTDFIKTLFPKFDNQGNIISGIRGIDEKNNNLDDAYLVGTCYIEKLTGAEYTEIKSHYPYLDIKFGEMTSNVIFKYSDADGNEHTHTESFTSFNSELGTCPNPELVPAPAWQENDAFTYEQVGWSRRQQISKGINDSENDYEEYIQADALLNIAGDRILYPVFKAVRKSYEIKFVNPTVKENSLLQSVMVPYGSDASYTEKTPEKLDAVSPDLYTFIGWHPSPEKITGPMICYAQFTILDDKWYTLGVKDISDCVDYNGNVFDGYTLNTANKTMAITDCNNKFNAAVKVPSEFVFDSDTYILTQLGGFSEHSKLELISIPESVSEIRARGFYNCYNLFEITLPKLLKTIGKSAFQGCAKLKDIFIPATVNSIGEAALADCLKLEKINVDLENTRYKVVQDCLIDTKSKKLLQGLTTAIIPQDGSITSLGQHCFSNTDITNIQIPEGVTNISTNAFSRCGYLTEVILPSTLEVLDATCFAWCSNLKNIELPSKLRTIRTYVFDSCAFENVTMPESIIDVLERSFGDMTSLKTVTFKKHLDENGELVIPNIHQNAFANSGTSDSPIVFNLPWSKEQHKAAFEVDTDGKPRDPFFGAIGVNYENINFDYEEEN